MQYQSNLVGFTTPIVDGKDRYNNYTAKVDRYIRNQRGSQVLSVGVDTKEVSGLQGPTTNTLTARYEKAQAAGSYILTQNKQLSQKQEQEIENPLKDKSPFGWHFEQNVYAENTKLIRSLKAGGGSGNTSKIIYDRNRIENIGEPMFTLTGQDLHGVYLEKKPKVDEVVYDVYNNCIRKDGIAGTLKAHGVSPTSLGTAIISNTVTTAFGRSGCSKEELTSADNVQRSIGQLRRLTPVECEFLQKFPKNWTAKGWDAEKQTETTISDTQRYKLAGNAVSVCVIDAIAKELNKYLFKQ